MEYKLWCTNFCSQTLDLADLAYTNACTLWAQHSHALTTCLLILAEQMVGWRQQLAWNAEAPASDSRRGSRKSSLCSYILRCWAWSLVSPSFVQTVAAKVLEDLEFAMQDPENAKAVKAEYTKLASIGTSGTYLNNMHRDLKTMVSHHNILLQYLQMPLCLAGAVEDAVISLHKQAILLPHIFFSAIGKYYPGAWRKLVCPSQARVSEFWEATKDSPQITGLLLNIHFPQPSEVYKFLSLATECTSLVYKILCV